MEVSLPPTLRVPTRQEVLCVEFCPHAWAEELLAVALPTALEVYSVTVEEETGALEHRLVSSCAMEAEAVGLAWSPRTSLHASPPCLRLLVATADHTVLLLTSDLQQWACEEVCRHSAAINSVAVSADGVAASVGDDLLLRVWRDGGREGQGGEGGEGSEGEEGDGMEGDEKREGGEWRTSIFLRQPGQCVKFHPNFPNSVLVLEVSGTLRMYRLSQSEDEEDDTDVQLSADWSARVPAPCLDADWSLADHERMVTAGPSGVTVLTVEAARSTSARPLPCAAHSAGVVRAALSRHRPALLAALTPACLLTLTPAAPLPRPPAAHQLPACGGLSWHLSRPVLAAGADRSLCIWRLNKL